MWTTEEVAKEFKLARMTVLRLIRKGRIHAVRVGNQYRIDDGEVERMKREGV
jgi:excisionase family DNA binding protein